MISHAADVPQERQSEPGSGAVDWYEAKVHDEVDAVAENQEETITVNAATWKKDKAALKLLKKHARKMQTDQEALVERNRQLERDNARQREKLNELEAQIAASADRDELAQKLKEAVEQINDKEHTISLINHDRAVLIRNLRLLEDRVTRMERGPQSPDAKQEQKEVEEEVFEYGRYYPIRGWTIPNLVKDPYEWGDAEGKARTLDSVELPAGWQWKTNWKVHRPPALVDAEGWQYAKFFLPYYQGWRAQPRKFDVMRRRRWMRVRVPTIAEAQNGAPASESAAGHEIPAIGSLSEKAGEIPDKQSET